MGKKGIMLNIVVLVFCLAPLHVFSVTVDWVSGDVTYNHLKSEWKELDVGMRLVPGDIVKTGMGSEATLIDDGMEIFILENSTFTISEKYEDDERKAGFMLFLGRMKFKLLRAREVEPEIQTQTVNLTIRGTEFEVGSGYDGSTLVLMSDGVVAVRGKTKELVLQEGEGTEVAFGEEPIEKFEIITRIINWEEWFSDTKDSVKGNELSLLNKFLERFEEIDTQIKNYEKTRADAESKRDEYIATRDKLRKEGKDEEATEYSRKAGVKGRIAYHSFMNIRFLALSSVGLYDLAVDIFSGVAKPSKELTDTFESIKKIYSEIENKYIYAGDREVIERKARKKKGCLNLF